ncbi:outer membrane beta-barrel protein [Chitinophaga japonensis]|nr:outer membrane beta-barrel protein [Chitinophaga japonensis]
MIMVVVCLCPQGVKAQLTDSLRRQNLQAVTVKAVKPLIVMKAGKIVLNVAESPLAAGGTALQVLLQAPGLVEQGNGRFALRGKKVTVLLDGKSSRLSGEALKEWLSVIPAGSIDRVELVANPPARYDAGGASVINIITAKNRNLGANGMLTAGAGAGRYARYTGGLGLNYRNARLNIYGNYDYMHNMQYYELRSTRYLANNTHIAENTSETRERDNHSFKAGMDYDITRRSSAGIMIKGMLNYRYRQVHTRSGKEYGAAMPDSFSTVATTGDLRLFNPALNVYYKVDFDTTGRQLMVNADYFDYNKAWSDNFVTDFYDEKGTASRQPYLLRDNSPADNTIISLTVDYSQPFWKGKLEAGIKGTFTSTDNDIKWEQQIGKTWSTDSSKTNHFIYRENISAGYLGYRRTIKKFDLQAGLRAEHTYMKGSSVTLGQTSKREQLNFFPTVLVLYNQSEEHQYGFSYRKSIERFSFNIVNPFITYVSQYFYYQGNPAIKPSIGHAFELSYTYDNKLSATLSYERYTQVLTDIYRRDTGQVVVSTYANLDGAHSVNASLTYSRQLLAGKWQTVNTAIMMYSRYEGKGAQELNNTGAGVYVNTSNTFKMPAGLSGELSATWYSPMTFGVYKMKSRYSMNAGIARSMLQNAGKLTLSVTDIFNTLNIRYNVASFGVISSYENKIESRFIKLTFSYKFGNQRVKAASSHKTGIEKELRRMGG